MCKNCDPAPPSLSATSDSSSNQESTTKNNCEIRSCQNEIGTLDAALNTINHSTDRINTDGA
jgi:hypothetical protein